MRAKCGRRPAGSMLLQHTCALLALVVGVAVADLTGQKCEDRPEQQWKLGADGTLQGTRCRTGHGPPGSPCKPRSEPPQCLTAGSKEAAGISLSLKPCASPPTAEQKWEITSADSFLVLSSDATMCANLEGYGTLPGTAVWGYKGCSTKVCKGNCDWHMTNSSAAGGFSLLQNTGSKLCLDSKAAPPPPPPPSTMPTMRTCAADSPAAKLKFCDQSLSMEVRAAALVANLTMAEKLNTFMLVGH